MAEILAVIILKFEQCGFTIQQSIQGLKQKIVCLG